MPDLLLVVADDLVYCLVFALKLSKALCKVKSGDVENTWMANTCYAYFIGLYTNFCMC